MAKLSFLYGASLAAHAALALGVAALRPPKHVETIAISVAEAKEKPKPAEPAKMTEAPKPVEDRAPKERVKAKVAPAAPKNDEPPPPATPQAAAAQALDAMPDFGLALGNGGPGGMAVPAGAGAPRPAASAVAAPARAPKVLEAKPAAADECTEAPIKPKPKAIAQPAYTASARDAKVEGRVRVEVTVDASGHVTNARLLSGVGYGLDEAAVEAAKRATFEPGTRCGKAMSATFVIAMRFTL